MKNFFQKNGIMMLAAVTVVAVLLCVASALSSQTGFLQNAGASLPPPSGRWAPLSAGGSAP